MQFIMGFEKTYLWEDPIASGIVFGSVLVTLISICYYSLISVVAYCSLTALLAVLSLKIYTYVMVTFLKKETVNPLAKCSGKYNIYMLYEAARQVSEKQILFYIILFYKTAENPASTKVFLRYGIFCSHVITIPDVPRGFKQNLFSDLVGLIKEAQKGGLDRFIH